MDASTFDNLKTLVVAYATQFGIKILAALAFWVIGRWLIHFVVRLVQNALGKQKVDPTLLRYVGSIVTVTLNVVLVIGILGYFGIQTTTFAALIAAAGVAIGMAWSGPRCWRYAPTATTTTAGRSISIPTASSANASARPAMPRRCPPTWWWCSRPRPEPAASARARAAVVPHHHRADAADRHHHRQRQRRAVAPYADGRAAKGAQ